MSTQHPSSPPPPPHPRGPERFAAPAPEAARRSPFAALGALLVLLVLVVGVPVGLWLWQGPPQVPTGLPSREDLTRPLTSDSLVVVLLAGVWLAWLQFTACVLVEVAALLRGGGLPRPVPFSGRSQALARVLVGTVLVGAAVVGTTAPAAAAGIAHDPAGSTAGARHAGTPLRNSPAHSPSGAPEQVPDPGGLLDDAMPSLVDGLRKGLGDAAGRLAGQKVVVVQPPEGRYHHNLWDIAEEHLGDGRRWKEIFELTKGRPQPDGGELVIGRLIQPGWVLVMPGDAVGTTRLDAPAGGDRAGVDRTTDTGERPDRVDRTGHVVEEVGDWTDPWDGGDDVRGETTKPTATEVSAPDGGDPAALPWELVGGGLLAAALAGALVAERRRRRGRDLTAAAALRRLVVTSRAAGLSLPPVYAATVSDEAIELRIAPAALPAPAPWTPLDEGRRWRLDRIASDSDRGELGNAPYPGLVCLGRDARGADVLIDLEAVGGPASITGSDAVAREVVAALAGQLVTSPWSDQQRVHAHHHSPGLAHIADPSLSTVDDLGALVAELEAAHPHADGGDVLARRAGRRTGPVPQYLFLGTAPDERLFERLQPMIRSGDRGTGVVAVGRLPGTRWQLRVDDAGHLSGVVIPVFEHPPSSNSRRSSARPGSGARSRPSPSSPSPARRAPPTTRTGRPPRCGSGCSGRWSRGSRPRSTRTGARSRPSWSPSSRCSSRRCTRPCWPRRSGRAA